jgi:hypothetical protein
MNPAFHNTHHRYISAVAAGNMTADEAAQSILDQMEAYFDVALLNTTLIRSFDPAFLRQNQLVPFLFHSGTLYVGARFIENVNLPRYKEIFRCDVRLLPISELFYLNVIDLLDKQSSADVATQATLSVPEEEDVTRTFQRMLSEAYRLRASDVHLEPQGSPDVLVRFRIDGLLHDMETLSSSEFDYRARLVSKIKVSADLDIAESRIPQDGRITECINGEPAREYLAVLARGKSCNPAFASQEPVYDSERSGHGGAGPPELLPVDPETARACAFDGPDRLRENQYPLYQPFPNHEHREKHCHSGRSD